MSFFVVGTAGHIDHGKSALVKALTGTDPDRLKEEKARGITTDLGFARLELPGGTVPIIDVPGHERFVKNMLAGAHGIDLALLVVSVSEGVKPQTAEHLAILELLGVRDILIVVSKLDLGDAARAEAVAYRVRRLAAGTPYAEAPHLACSARTGAGLDALRAFLAAKLAARAEAPPPGLFRLPVDRVFSVAGAGTVVTGTTLGGSVKEGEELEVYPADLPLAGGARARVRAIETLGARRKEAPPRARAALNLAVQPGGTLEGLRRGALLAPPGALAEDRYYVAKLRLLKDTPELRDLETVNLHHLAAEFTARVRLLGGARKLEPGREAWVQFWLDEARPLSAGDRLVLRRISPALTWGGATVLAPAPRLRKEATVPEAVAALFPRDPAAAALWTLLEQHAIAGLAPLAARAGLSQSEAAAALVRLRDAGRARTLGKEWADPPALDARRKALLATLARLHDAEPERSGFPRDRLPAELRHEGWLAELAADAQLVNGPDGWGLPGRGPRRDGAAQSRREELLALFEKAGLEGPDPAKLFANATDKRIYEELLREGKLIRVRHDCAIDAAADAKLRVFLRAHRAGGKPLQVADLKNAFGLSRKWAVPLLEYCDMKHWTRRTGDAREIVRDPPESG